MIGALVCVTAREHNHCRHGGHRRCLQTPGMAGVRVLPETLHSRPAVRPGQPEAGRQVQSVVLSLTRNLGFASRMGLCEMALYTRCLNVVTAVLASVTFASSLPS